MLTRDLCHFTIWIREVRSSNSDGNKTASNQTNLPNYVRESLSNVLLTYIDFRPPILDSRRLNSSKPDESINKVPESCIEEFNLYVSTWKGWQGPFPSKYNRVTWQDVEKENTVDGTVTCKHVSPTFQDKIHNWTDENSNTSTTIPPPDIISESFRFVWNWF